LWHFIGVSIHHVQRCSDFSLGPQVVYAQFVG
jgi:hypothetical protein